MALGDVAHDSGGTGHRHSLFFRVRLVWLTDRQEGHHDRGAHRSRSAAPTAAGPGARAGRRVDTLLILMPAPSSVIILR